ncbi:peptide chain release factor N(5)-glutamine methyltransferase [Blochmannia endosymbiont of Colobopsis nipponica]|uniref:peptide chain release factor N(5)-glutamine methyltransferase n=1 Tax=Blochmannia endosymbiont of Colobopsis nipponica TaxID=2681987 RepID=UPI00177D2457|nr:peptide chain release factor N(5)-glutamine methyltransferase [Blochmannia endosymbiont of Colobopsis nipponica]QOI11095.1 peptide chain release factor N(5)-glutamine methyltransferase [Blochmannia endosymbiont of Colobopsis nipponica]
MNWKQWLQWANIQLLQVSTTPKLDAEIILSKTLGKSRTFLLAFGETKLNFIEKSCLDKLLLRRQKMEPIAYITGVQEFWSLNIQVYHNIFIPRPDTEILVEQVLNLFTISKIRMLDLGTGTGAISLAIASEQPDWKIIAIDCQIQAINLARINAFYLNCKNILFLHGNWFDLLQGIHFDVIVSNPPYIDIKDPYFSPKNLDFESKKSLISEENGLADLKYIIQHSSLYLLHGGWLILEHGWRQGECVRKLFYDSKFKNITTFYDYNSYERITRGQWLN